MKTNQNQLPHFPTNSGPSGGSIKLARASEEWLRHLWLRNRSAYFMLIHIGLKAWTGPGLSPLGLAPGECWLSHDTCGLTAGEYKWAKKILQEIGIVVFTASSYGTKASLLSNDAIDIGLDSSVTDRPAGD